MAASAAAVAGSMLFFPLSVSPQLFAQDAKMENSFFANLLSSAELFANVK